MTKDLLLEKVLELDLGKEHQKTLKGWINALPTASRRAAPSGYKRGDVFIHRILAHPLVILKIIDGEYICGMLTTESTCPEIIEQTRSRFFGSNYFTSVILRFKTISPELSTWINVYDNNKHLKKVYKKLKKLMYV